MVSNPNLKAIGHLQGVLVFRSLGDVPTITMGIITTNWDDPVPSNWAVLSDEQMSNG